MQRFVHQRLQIFAALILIEQPVNRLHRVVIAKRKLHAKALLLHNQTGSHRADQRRIHAALLHVQQRLGDIAVAISDIDHVSVLLIPGFNHIGIGAANAHRDGFPGQIVHAFDIGASGLICNGADAPGIGRVAKEILFLPLRGLRRLTYDQVVFLGLQPRKN
ncbi:hypothetical protein SDC9_167030 [bioreactor metagenome]|uniref:Uncharacterized protein n=1 Tax=bioreactor metagenome TaxID=1076179 RepID=A0A645FYN0_9ZZZZ